MGVHPGEPNGLVFDGTLHYSRWGVKQHEYRKECRDRANLVDQGDGSPSRRRESCNETSLQDPARSSRLGCTEPPPSRELVGEEPSPKVCRDYQAMKVLDHILCIDSSCHDPKIQAPTNIVWFPQQIDRWGIEPGGCQLLGKY